jgi:hypothetical protein
LSWSGRRGIHAKSGAIGLGRTLSRLIQSGSLERTTLSLSAGACSSRWSTLAATPAEAPGTEAPGTAVSAAEATSSSRTALRSFGSARTHSAPRRLRCGGLLRSGGRLLSQSIAWCKRESPVFAGSLRPGNRDLFGFGPKPKHLDRYRPLPVIKIEFVLARLVGARNQLLSVARSSNSRTGYRLVSDFHKAGIFSRENARKTD